MNFAKILSITALALGLLVSGLSSRSLAADDAGTGKPAPMVVMYSTSWCGYCKMARNFFKSRKIEFVDYDIEKDRDAYDRFRAINPQGGVPTVVIGKKIVLGYSEDAYKTALENPF